MKKNQTKERTSFFLLEKFFTESQKRAYPITEAMGHKKLNLEG